MRSLYLIYLNLLYGIKQGQDSVIACVYKDGKVEAKSFYNIPEGKHNLPMTVIFVIFV